MNARRQGQLRAAQPASARAPARTGRSQVQVIEEALERMPVPRLPAEEQERWNRIAAVLESVDPASIPTMAEFDREEYDENGSPR